MARKNREPETGQIDSVTHDGRGIVSADGKKVFVAGAMLGERVRYQRRKRRRNYDEAELLEVFEASPNRVAAKCSAFGRCGGCAMQHISAAEQRDIKSQALADNLQRIGNVSPKTWLEPLCGEDWHYRRRARLAVKDVPAKGRVLVGFRERHAPFVTDMQRCEILAQPMDGLLVALGELIGTLTISARLPQIEVAIADNAVALVFRVLDAPTTDDLALIRAFGRTHGLQLWLQPGGLDTLHCVWPEEGGEPLHYALPEYDLRIEFEPTDFVQVNAAVNRRMVHATVGYLELAPGDRVLDLYCGVGNFTLPLARSSAAVLGIEGDPALVDRARANARKNGLENADFRCTDLSALDGSESWLKAGWDRLLLDPARSGAADVVRHMRTLDPARIVYVSCHPGTLARDAGTLVAEFGYSLEAAGIIDMFPHTAHVESVAVFCK